MQVAIDGPVGAGKTSLAREAARILGYVYVDTGALYRAVALYCVNNSVDVDNEAAVTAALPQVTVKICINDNVQHIILNDTDVSDDIRQPAISMGASTVSRYNAVRLFLLELQRDMAKNGNVIMDGRDIGTVILPSATVKIFITASAEKRAKRRYDELKGSSTTYEEVLSDLVRRDYNDTTREISPLKQAADAVLIDTTELTFNESLFEILKVIATKINI